MRATNATRSSKHTLHAPGCKKNSPMCRLCFVENATGCSIIPSILGTTTAAWGVVLASILAAKPTATFILTTPSLALKTSLHRDLIGLNPVATIQMTEPKTIVIVSNLSRDDFVVAQSNVILLVDEIKLKVLNLVVDGNPNYYLQHITLWSNLPFLLRVIVIVDDEAAAEQLSEFLRSLGIQGLEHAKITLQENLLLRSKSFDNFETHKIDEKNSLGTREGLEKFRNYHNEGGRHYEEPQPQPFSAYEDLQKLGIDLSEINSDEQLQELKDGGVKRSRSMTKTLFKPNNDAPRSPSITLDETFE